jgi:hypothetical protein
VTVIPVNDPPISTTASIITRLNTTSAGVTPTVNDIDIGDTFTFSILTQPSSGAAYIQSNQLYYQPALDFTGSDSFTYRAFDSGSEYVDGMASVIIFGTNSAPIAYSQSIKTFENTDTPIVLTGSDYEGDILNYSIVSAPSNGALTGTPPNVIYRPDPDYIGQDSFTFKTNDGSLDSIPADVQITVDPIPHIWFVDIDAAGNADGNSWANAFKHPQNALDVTRAGDQVWVAEGVYGPFSGRNFVITMTGGVPLYGGFNGTETSLSERDFNTHLTVLDGEDTVNVVNGADNAQLDGFIITRGKLNGMVNTGVSPTIVNCSFENNGLVEGQDGGAIQNIQNANALILNTTFINNYRSAIYNEDSSPTIDNCSFLNNQSDSGGAIKNIGPTTQPYIGFSIFDSNSASLNGGAISNDASNPLVENCTFTGNAAGGNGGAVSNENGAVPIIINSLFSNNTAAQLGGAVFNSESDPTLLNCTISNNYADSYGGGIVSENGKGISPDIINSIIWYNSDIQIHDVSEGKTKVTYSNIQEKMKGKDNINEDPIFIDPAAGNFRLGPGSPCIDTGDNKPVLTPTDLDGNPRITDGTGDGKVKVDMGAFEYVP